MKLIISFLIVENEEELAKFQTSSMGLEQNGFQVNTSFRENVFKI